MGGLWCLEWLLWVMYGWVDGWEVVWENVWVGGWMLCESFGGWYVHIEFGQGFRLVGVCWCERASSATGAWQDLFLLSAQSLVTVMLVSVWMGGGW